MPLNKYEFVNDSVCEFIALEDATIYNVAVLGTENIGPDI